MKTKIIEFDEVYLEYPELIELDESSLNLSEEDLNEEYKNYITKMSLEELQEKLEETRARHL